MSNKTFEMGRFSELVKQTLKSKKKAFVITLLVIALLPLLLILIDMFYKSYPYDGGSSYTHVRFYRNVFAVSAILAPYLSFFQINRPRKRRVEAMLHTSVLENFLNMALFCFVLLQLFALIVYGISHTIFATVFPQYLYKFPLIFLQSLFSGRLFIPSLILSMQTIFFLNILYSDNKIKKTVITYVAVLLVYTFLVCYTNIFMMGVPVSLLVLERFSVFLFVLLLYVLPMVLLIWSYLIMKKKGYPIGGDVAARENI